MDPVITLTIFAAMLIFGAYLCFMKNPVVAALFLIFLFPVFVIWAAFECSGYIVRAIFT
jgi:hypothetical protein